MYDIIIIGGGPAGLTAAIYARRAGKSVLVLEKELPGGQITHSPLVENFPGFTSITGADLGDTLAIQATTLGAIIDLDEAIKIEKINDIFYIYTSFASEPIQGKSVILATGAKPRRLNLPKEDEFEGRGVHYCAVCDGAFYEGKPVAVYGGGNSALQEALLLSRTSCKVFLIYRGNKLKGEEVLIEKLKSTGNVDILTNTTITELIGKDKLDAIKLQDPLGERNLEISALFIAIGHQPDNTNFENIVSLNQAGYVISSECATSTPGLFVAGDCRTKDIRQLTTAVADGTVAALSAINYIG